MIVTSVPRVRAETSPAADGKAPAAAPLPPVYVNDLADLQPLVSGDPELSARVTDLARRRSRAGTVGMASIVGGLALVALGVMSLQEPPEDCPSACFARTTPVTWPLIGGGLGIAVVGGLAAYWMAPPRRALLGIIDPWNRRNPEHPIALQDVPCGDGDRQCADKPFPLPPELVPVGVVFKVRGRHALASQLRFGAFAAQKLDRGLRHTRMEAHRRRYRKTLEHVFTFSLRSEQQSMPVRCRDWASEEGDVSWGSEVRAAIGPIRLERDSETTFTPEISAGGFSCDMQTPDGTPLQIARTHSDDPGFVLLDVDQELLRARPYRESAQHSYWWETTDGFRIDEGGRPIAIVDLTETGRVALSTRVDPTTALRAATLIMAIILDWDRHHARSLDDSVLNPLF